MLYHYFGSKSQLYVAVLEEALAGCANGSFRSTSSILIRARVCCGSSISWAIFEHNHHLVRLLSAENLLKAKYMRKSSRIPEMSSPVLSMIEHLIVRGTEAGQLPPGLDALRLYVLMVALTQFHLSNGYTLSIIFGRDLSELTWRKDRASDARRMLAAFLKA